MQSKKGYILATLLTHREYTLDLLEGTRAEYNAIRSLWAEGIIERVAEDRDDSKVKFIPRQNNR